MRINRGTSRPPCGFTAYDPNGLPVYRGGGVTPPTPPPSSVFEFGADDAQVGAYFPGGTAMDLITPTKVRSTIAATNTQQAQFEDGLIIPPATGNLVIPAAYAGIVGYELEMTLPDLSATTFDGYFFMLLSLTDSGGGQYAPIVWWSTAAGQWSIGDLGANNLALGSGGSYRIAVDSNYSTDQITLRSGSSIAYTGAAGPSLDSFPVAQSSSFINTVGTGLGATMDLELIQDSADFTETHVGGAVALADALEVKS